MKKTLLAIGIASVSLLACKKDTTPAPAVDANTVVTVEDVSKNDNLNKSLVWYSATTGKTYSMNDVNANLQISQNMDFGFNIGPAFTGLYSPTEYPVVYGQNNWTFKNNTTFRTIVNNEADVKDKFENHPDLITSAFINTTYQEALDLGTKVELLANGQIFPFQTTTGKIGLLYIIKVDAPNKIIQLDIKVAK
jgi:hypothetical protein